MSPGSTAAARANVVGPLVIVASASGRPISTIGPTGSAPWGLYDVYSPDDAALPW